MKDKIEEILKSLSEERPIFWSEADFQFAFAWKIQKAFPKAKVRLERREEICKDGKDDTKIPAYIDIWVEMEDDLIPIELKYKTKECTIKHNGEDYNLTTHSACDLGCHDYLKDIERIEQLAKKDDFKVGYAIMITNDMLYINPPKSSKATSYDEFRIYEGREFKGDETLKWKPSQKEGRTDVVKWQSDSGSVNIHGKYKIEWEKYSHLEVKNGTFKYTICEITKD